MRLQMSSFSRLNIVLATALFATMPLPLAADVVNATQFDFFSEAGTGVVYFTVNPDGSLSGGPCVQGSLCGIVTSAPLNWDLGVTGQCCFPEGNLSALDFPALPPGSTINSATFSWSAGAGLGPSFPGNADFDVQGSLGLQSVNGPCGLLVVSSNAGMCSFTPGSTGETFYYPDFSGGAGAALVAEIPIEPGFYSGGANVIATATFTITEDYSTTPEPRTYGFLVGLGLVGLFAIRSRARLQSA